MSIPNVASGVAVAIYHPAMAKKTPPSWAERFEAIRLERNIPTKALAEKMGKTPAALRHWLNGHREITLQQFLDLCGAAKFDPIQVLYGAGYISDEIREQVVGLSKAVLEAKPAPYRAAGAPARKRVRS